MSDPNVSAPVAPAEAISSAPATPAIPETPPQSAIPAATPASATPSTPPEGYVPSYRLREAREAATRQAREEAQREMAQIRAESEQYRQKLHALAGVTPPPDPQIDAVRQQFGQLYPGLSRIEERAEEIMSILERAGDLESQSAHYWQSYGRQTMDRLFTHAADALGNPLTDEGKRALHSSFVGFIQSSPELSDRYANDPTIVEDFWKAFSSTFIDPVRRTSAATAVTRAGVPLPQDAPGGVPRATPAPQLGSLDDRAAAAWAQYQTTKK